MSSGPLKFLLMTLFGGDPRLIYFQMLVKFNQYYDYMFLPILIIIQLKRWSDQDSLIIFFVFMVFEIIRIIISDSHFDGNIPKFVAFLILTFIPTLIFDIVWILAVAQITSFDEMIMIGFIFIHLLELIFGVWAYLYFTKYQHGFFQFAKGKMYTLQKEDIQLDTLGDQQ